RPAVERSRNVPFRRVPMNSGHFGRSISSCMPRSSSAAKPHCEVFLTIVSQSHLGHPRVETAIGGFPAGAAGRRGRLATAEPANLRRLRRFIPRWYPERQSAVAVLSGPINKDTVSPKLRRTQPWPSRAASPPRIGVSDFAQVGSLFPLGKTICTDGAY